MSSDRQCRRRLRRLAGVADLDSQAEPPRRNFANTHVAPSHGAATRLCHHALRQSPAHANADLSARQATALFVTNLKAPRKAALRKHKSPRVAGKVLARHARKCETVRSAGAVNGLPRIKSRRADQQGDVFAGVAVDRHAVCRPAPCLAGRAFACQTAWGNVGWRRGSCRRATTSSARQPGARPSSGGWIDPDPGRR